ncbi:Fc.00g114280.m01.CDS01 [Cosmosporella sp. VM-42]
MHLILTGATGLIGCATLDAMLKAKDITKISILSRRPVALAEQAKDPRVEVIIHKDFNKYPPQVLERLKGAQGCVWSLGVSQNAVSEDEYVSITKDYTLNAARAFGGALGTATDPFRFVFVSGEGATQKPGMTTVLYGRVKGETEAELADLMKTTPGLHVDSLRPGIVDALRHKAIIPFIPYPGFALKWGREIICPIARVALKTTVSPSDILGSCLTEMAMGKLDGKIEGQGAFKLGPSWVVENVGFRRIMGI